MTSQAIIEQKEIEEFLPHRAPFLFVDRVLELTPHRHIIAERTLRPDEPHFEGHFPGKPIMPGVLITEALAQTAGLLLALTAQADGEDVRGRIFYLAKSATKWLRPVTPNTVLKLAASFQKVTPKLISFEVRAFTDDHRKDVAVGSLVLARVDE